MASVDPNMGVALLARQFRTAIVVALAVVFGGMLVPAGADAAAGPLSVLGGAGTRNVTLRLTDPQQLPVNERTSSALLERQKGEVLYGRLNLVVRNDGDEGVKLNIGYRSDSESGVVALPGSSDVVELESNHASGGSPSHAQVGKHSSRELRLVFVLPIDQPPSALDGTITVKAEGATGGLEIRLAGAADAMKAVTFVPDSATLQVTHWQLVGGGETTSKVRLVGSGAREALRDLHLAGTTSITAELRRDAQHQITVTLGNLQADPVDPQAVVGTLTFGGHSLPGSYTGTLSLSSFADSSPTLKLEERSRYWIVWAVLLIFIGALASGWATRTYALKRRRELVQNALADVTAEYLNERPNPDDGTEQWSLADVIIDGPPDEQWKSYEPLDTSARIAAALRWARNDEDIDEASTAALALAVRVTSWQMVHLLRSDLAALKELADDPKRSRWRPDHPWADTHTALETVLTLEAARHEPADSAAALALADRIRRQVAWHRAFLEAWNLNAQLTKHAGALGESGHHEQAQALTDALKTIKLDDVDAQLVLSATRSAENQATGLYRLDLSVKQLLALAKRYELDPVRDTAGQAGAFNPSAARLAQSLRTLEQHQAQPQFAFALLRPRLAPTAHDVTAADGVPARSAEPAGSGGARPTADVATRSAMDTSDAGTPGRRTSPSALLAGRKTVRSRGSHQRLGDILVSGAVVATVSVAYALTAYTDTWGSSVDVASALLAGAAGKVAVDWAALPIFRSFRLRATTTG
jgi:hypothetical protein